MIKDLLRDTQNPMPSPTSASSEPVPPALFSPLTSYVVAKTSSCSKPVVLESKIHPRSHTAER